MLIWIKSHWRVALVALGSVLAFLLGGLFVRQLRQPGKAIRRELDASKAGQEAAESAIALGKERAIEVLEYEHAEAIKAVDAAEAIKLEKLRTDPVAYARHLSKLSSRRRG